MHDTATRLFHHFYVSQLVMVLFGRQLRSFLSIQRKICHSLTSVNNSDDFIHLRYLFSKQNAELIFNRNKQLGLSLRMQRYPTAIEHKRTG